MPNLVVRFALRLAWGAAHMLRVVGGILWCIAYLQGALLFYAWASRDVERMTAIEEWVRSCLKWFGLPAKSWEDYAFGIETWADWLPFLVLVLGPFASILLAAGLLYSGRALLSRPLPYPWAKSVLPRRFALYLRAFATDREEVGSEIEDASPSKDPLPIFPWLWWLARWPFRGEQVSKARWLCRLPVFALFQDGRSSSLANLRWIRVQGSRWERAVAWLVRRASVVIVAPPPQTGGVSTPGLGWETWYVANLLRRRRLRNKRVVLWLRNGASSHEHFRAQLPAEFQQSWPSDSRDYHLAVHFTLDAYGDIERVWSR